MNNSLMIEVNRQVNIESITQWFTYSGLLEGLPTKKMNERILADVRLEAAKFCYINEIHVIEPEQRRIQYEGKYPFGEPYELPPVICVASVKYFGACRDHSKDYAVLGLVWFQREFAFPIDEMILS